jgi:hypothetical protein
MPSISFSRLVAGIACAMVVSVSSAAISQSVPTRPVTPSEDIPPTTLISQIDVTCDTMVQQQQLIKPVHVVYDSSNWKVVSDGDLAVATRTNANAALADVWKQNGKYVWVHAHSMNQNGTQRATQLCFRTDGTLARVRQAQTVPALAAADATRAYYNTGGTMVAKFGVYEENDPALAKVVTALPYYKILP